jgi:ClpP class serine protease
MYLLPDIGERLFGRPHMIEPAALRARLNSASWQRALSGEPYAGQDDREMPVKTARRRRLAAIVADRVRVAGGAGEYAVTPEGIAVVPVLGVLTARADWFTTLCGWTTYEGLAAIFDSAEREPRVKAILMDIESPGGEAAGMIDIAERIMAARSSKPVWAVANGYAFSAAYAIAGSAELLLVPRLCQVGSIGAVSIHCDQSGADSLAGERYTAIYAGARKVDGWGHAPLSEDARGAIQASVDYCRTAFANLIGRQGRMTAKAAMATEAGVYHDQEAVNAKLADRVGTFEDALAELTERAGGTQSRMRAFNTPPGARKRASVEKTGTVAVIENARGIHDARAEFQEFAGAVRDLCELAGMPEIGGDLIVSCRTLEEARTEIIDRRAAADEALQINTVHGMPVARSATAWDKTVDDLNARDR